MSGMLADKASKSLSVRGTPILPAIANKWMTKLVDPPIAALTLIAFSNARRVRISDNLKSSRTMSAMRNPESRAKVYRLESAAGIAALPGKESPSDSTMQAIEEAVPITAQWPRLRHMAASIEITSSSSILFSRIASWRRHISLVPMLAPLYRPVNIGPPDTTRVGRLTLHAPITSEGVVLSHPHNSTTPSIGLARIDSSTSMLAKVRYKIA